MRLTFLILIILLLPAHAAGQDTSVDLAPMDQALGLYEEGDYQAALAIFKTMQEAGLDTPALHYNMANTYLRLDLLGPAVYWYERAAMSAPGDEDIAFNRAYALSLIVDRQEHETGALEQAVFFLDGQLAPLSIEILFLVLAGGFWLCLYLAPRVGLPALRQAAWTLLFLAALVAPSALYQQYDHHFVDQGIILPDTASVRAGLTDEATELFTLHAGSRVLIEDERNGFCRIRFGTDKIGWLPLDAVGVL